MSHAEFSEVVDVAQGVHFINLEHIIRIHLVMPGVWEIILVDEQHVSVVEGEAEKVFQKLTGVKTSRAGKGPPRS